VEDAGFLARDEAAISNREGASLAAFQRWPEPLQFISTKMHNLCQVHLFFFSVREAVTRFLLQVARRYT